MNLELQKSLFFASCIGQLVPNLTKNASPDAEFYTDHFALLILTVRGILSILAFFPFPYVFVRAAPLYVPSPKVAQSGF